MAAYTFEGSMMPDQLLVIGEGMEPESSPWGDLRYNSPFSGDTHDNVVATVELVRDYPDIRRVVFSGKHDITLPDHEARPITEAEAMEAMAQLHELAVPTEIEAVSMLDSEHFLFGLQFGLIDATRPLGVVAHRHRADRLVRLGQLALPDVAVEPIYSDNAGRMMLDSGLRRRKTNPLPGIVLDAAMTGVKPGDIETMRARSRMVRKALAPALAVSGFVQRQRGPLWQKSDS